MRILILFLSLFFLSCAYPKGILILDPYHHMIFPELSQEFEGLGRTMNYEPHLIVLEPNGNWEKADSQILGEGTAEPAFFLLSGLYSGALYQGLRERYPEIPVVFLEGAQSFVDGNTGVVYHDRVSSFEEMGRLSAQWFEPLSLKGWSPPGLLAYTRPQERNREKNAFLRGWDEVVPDQKIFVQEFNRLRDFVDLTRLVSTLITEEERPWVAIFASAMNKDALDQIPGDKLILGEGLKSRYQNSTRLLASVEDNPKNLVKEGVLMALEGELSYRPVFTQLWLNPRTPQMLLGLKLAQKEDIERIEMGDFLEDEVEDSSSLPPSLDEIQIPGEENPQLEE